ncbi:MAG: universal stress protein [Desulfobacterales bacterium]|nr:universal stress protein [Desulfobacterales bacterium]
MKFLACYDGTKTAEAALRKAAAHAKVWGANLVVVRSISRELPLKRSRIEKAEEELDNDVKSLLKEEAPPYETLLLVSTPDVGEQLVDVAESENIDQIFVGIEKKSKVGKLFFGSTAQYVILNATCPVVGVKA